MSRSLIFCFHAVCTVSASFKHFASVNRCFLFQRTMPGHVGGRRGACMACDSNAHWCSLAGEAVSKRIILWKLGNFGGAPVSESLRGGPVCWNCRKSSLAFLKVRRAHPFMISVFCFAFCALHFSLCCSFSLRSGYAEYCFSFHTCPFQCILMVIRAVVLIEQTYEALGLNVEFAIAYLKKHSAGPSAGTRSKTPTGTGTGTVTEQEHKLAAS